MNFSNNLVDNNYLAKRVYDIDPIKKVSGKRPFVGGTIVGNNNYRVLDISRDGTYGPHHKYGAKNGMQAVTVAPVDKKGKVDYGHITIAYAGTNMADGADIATDIENIVAPLQVYIGDGVKQS